MGWIRVTQGVPSYSGHLAAPPGYAAWARGPGEELVARAAGRRRFTLVGRTRTARNELWGELQHAAEKGLLAESVRDTVRHFTTAPGEIAAASVNLPRAFVEGRRVVAVPRVTCVARAFNAMAAELDHHPAVAALGGGVALRDFFYNELVSAADAAVIQASSDMRRPMPTAEGWYVVGFEPTLSWFVPVLGGPERRGHFYVYEAPRSPVKQWPFRSLESRVRELRAATAALSRMARDEMLRSTRELTDPRPFDGAAPALAAS
jgi:hypothetical protein